MKSWRIFCVVRSSSGDTDIPVVLLAMPLLLHVCIDNETGKSHKILVLRKSYLTHLQRKALLGMHAFSGNDYVSSMLRKGKHLCWNYIKDNEQFLGLFCSLGTEMPFNGNLLYGLENFLSAQCLGKKGLIQWTTLGEKFSGIEWRRIRK